MDTPQRQIPPERKAMYYGGMALVGLGLLLFLSTFALSGLGMFLLGRELTGSAAAGFVAGLAFAFAPYRIANIPHPSSIFGPRRGFGCDILVVGSGARSRRSLAFWVVRGSWPVASGDRDRGLDDLRFRPGRDRIITENRPDRANWRVVEKSNPRQPDSAPRSSPSEW